MHGITTILVSNSCFDEREPIQLFHLDFNCHFVVCTVIQHPQQLNSKIAIKTTNHLSRFRVVAEAITYPKSKNIVPHNTHKYI